MWLQRFQNLSRSSTRLGFPNQSIASFSTAFKSKGKAKGAGGKKAEEDATDESDDRVDSLEKFYEASLKAKRYWY